MSLPSNTNVEDILQRIRQKMHERVKASKQKIVADFTERGYPFIVTVKKSEPSPQFWEDLLYSFSDQIITKYCEHARVHYVGAQDTKVATYIKLSYGGDI